jgi:hypothetical protein
VVGQLIEYASALRGMAFAEFSDRFEARAGKPLALAVGDIAGEAFDDEAFKAQVTENLGAGRFRMVVVVDSITEALKQTVVYLNEHLDGSLLALELAYLRDGEVEMLLPAVYGEESAARKERSRKPPVADADTVVVAARDAYDFYVETSAYVCQAGRKFRDGIKYLGFYKDKAIQRQVPAIRHRRDNVVISLDEAHRLRASGDEKQVLIGKLIEDGIQLRPDMEGRPHQIFLLSSPSDEATLILPDIIRNTKRGAWTQGQRYTASGAIKRGPSTTDELAAEGG